MEYIIEHGELPKNVDKLSNLEKLYLKTILLRTNADVDTTALSNMSRKVMMMWGRDKIKQQLEIVIGEILGGNDNSMLKVQLADLLEIAYENGLISRDSVKSLTKKYIIDI
jgi:hypothetical protein